VHRATVRPPPVATLPPPQRFSRADVPPSHRVASIQARPIYGRYDRSVAQQAHAQTCLCIGRRQGSVRSRPKTSHWSASLASHWPWRCIARCTFVIALTGRSASATQLVWQSVTGVHIADVDAHIAVQACCRSGRAGTAGSLSAAPTPPSQREFHCADPSYADATPTVPDDLPPLPVCRREFHGHVAVEPQTRLQRCHDVPPPPDVRESSTGRCYVEPPEAISTVLMACSTPEVPPRVVAPRGAPPRHGVVVVLEQANANSIAAGRMRTIELCFALNIPIR